jgi:hypothetical protein
LLTVKITKTIWREQQREEKRRDIKREEDERRDLADEEETDVESGHLCGNGGEGEEVSKLEQEKLEEHDPELTPTGLHDSGPGLVHLSTRDSERGPEGEVSAVKSVRGREGGIPLVPPGFESAVGS